MSSSAPTLPVSVVRSIANQVQLDETVTVRLAQALSYHGLAGRALLLVKSAEGAAYQILRNRAVQTRADGIVKVALAVEASAALESGGVPVLCFKGPALAAMLMEPVGLRPYSDIDLLIERNNLGRADQVLRALGCQPRHRHPRMLWAESWLEVERGYAGTGPAIDLHWRVDTPAIFRISAAELLARRVAVTVGEERLTTLDPVDALLVSAVHGTREGWHQLKWVIDMCRQVDQITESQLREAVERAHQAHCRRALLTALALTEKAGIALPGGVDPGPQAAARAARIPLDGSTRRPPSGHWQSVQWQYGKMRMADSPSDALSGMQRAVGRTVARSLGGWRRD
ncbi:MAG: nucleotidyltransferase domain-containing protein [Candidatus Nanopelagicales bacterium]